MKRILVVDDEYLVRLGLKTIIDWARFGCIIAGEAANGKEAFDFFEKNQVDVILTDIKMPVMDGLELTRKVKAINKKVQIIILSHYDEFSYAQEAINLGAFRYLLKSELTKTNLENVLKSLHFSSDDVQSAEQGVEWKEQWEAYINDRILQTFAQPSNEIFGEIQKLSQGTTITPTPYKTDECVVFSVSCRITLLASDAREKFPKAVKVLFDEAFGNLAGKGHYYNNDFQFVAIAFHAKPQQGEEHLLYEKINNFSVQIVKNLHQYYDVNIFIGVSSLGKPNSFWQLLQEAHRARIGCFFSDRLFVNIFSESNDLNAGKVEKKGSIVNYTKLVAFFDTDQKETMHGYIQNIFTGLRIYKDYTATHDFFIDFLSVGKLIHEKYQLKEEASLSENKFKHDIFYDLPFIDDVEKYIYELYLSLFSTKQNGQASYSHIVKKCIDFIHSDFKNNIGLSEAAEKAGVSHSYLSFIFKQETGVNFNAALTQYRIEKAKKLLITTGLRIYQVAEQVGFSNPYYFSKVFKEISGYTCKEYRDRGEE
ncbi:MAG: response regulator [Treponema sp.]|jgi:two-component system response regulator YesN|nr:response regulator [Treponema sp.]